LMLLLFMGVAPDVMRHGGSNWVNQMSTNLADQYKEGYYESAAGHGSAVEHESTAEHH
jgi:hypothetical protein